MGRIPRHRLAPWVHMLILGATASLILAVLGWLKVTVHPEAVAIGAAAVSRVIGVIVAALPHFKNGTAPRELDTAREVLYGKVLQATDTLTVIQAELDLAYSRVVKLRDLLPKE